MKWCRRILEAVDRQPPEQSRFDHATSVGNIRWDAFIAECGVEAAG